MAAQPAAESTPVNPLNTQPAQIYTHIHPLLVLAVFYASFSSTVQDPVSTLLYLLLPLSVLQAAYVAICIPQAPDARPTTAPATQTSSNKSSNTPQPRRKPKSAAPAQVSIISRVTQSIFATLLSALLTPIPLTIVLILQGAPLTSHIQHTVLLATHMALLSTIPLFYAHGVSSRKWQEITSLAAPVDELMGAAIGTIVGAWLGAIPIPLDWDREWQKWPVTVVTGAYLGWAAGKVLGGTVCRGWKVKFHD